MQNQSNYWQQYRLEQKIRRGNRRTYWLQELSRLKRAGFTVQQLAQDHYRINGEIDFYLVHAQYHNLQNGKRGKILHNLIGFVRRAVADNYQYRQTYEPRKVTVYLPEE